MLKKFLVFIFISFLLAGCTSDKIDISMNNGNVRAIRDYEGTIVELPEKPKRILTLSLGFDVMTLGLDSRRKQANTGKVIFLPL